MCALHAPDIFSMDDWGYPSLVGGGEIAPGDEPAVRRALFDCPAHAIVDLEELVPLQAGGGPGVARAARSAPAAGPALGGAEDGRDGCRNARSTLVP
ncbi:ferredoxin [Streptomyces sp. NPDC048106]|uniref:ferredoxin n=1 Tax=Streptomyces sp. NPDC048106 TaxID=3155750 RepID=UPI003453A77D